MKKSKVANKSSVGHTSVVFFNKCENIKQTSGLSYKAFTFECLYASNHLILFNLLHIGSFRKSVEYVKQIKVLSA
jgi:hypothetical protein